MKKFIVVLWGVFAAVLIISSLSACKKEKYDCTTVSATYNDTVKSIINAKCAISGCHLNTQSPLLTTYAQVSANGNKIASEAIDHSTMPPAGSTALTSDEKAILDCWRDAGFPEN